MLQSWETLLLAQSDQVLGEKKEEIFRLAQLAALQHERDGFRWLGQCFRSEIGCNRDMNLAKENFLIAAELGDVYAADEFGSLLEEREPARWLWRSRAALHGLPLSFLVFFPNHVKRFFSGSGDATIVFLIGRALRESISTEKKQIFGSSFYYDSCIDPAIQAVSFYVSQIKSARHAVGMWTIIGIRFGIVNDVRKLIGKIIWDARAEANYPLQVEPKNVRRCFIQ